MTERERFGLRGPVRACRAERILWLRDCGAEPCEVRQTTYATKWLFRPEGGLAGLEHENPDGSRSASTFHYDDSGQLTSATFQSGDAVAETSLYARDGAGRVIRVTSQSSGLPTESYAYDLDGVKTKVLHLHLDVQRHGTQFGCAIEKSGSIFSAASPATATTRYNEAGHTAELAFHSASGQLLSRVECVYDASGNLVEERESRPSEAFPPDMFGEMTSAQIAAIKNVLGAGGEPMRHTHAYDERGRRIETRHSMPPLSVRRKTTAYDEHDNPVFEVDVEEEREFQINDTGELHPAPDTETVRRVEVRFEYEYDEQGNWIMKTTSARRGSEQDFAVSSTERRVIEYF